MILDVRTMRQGRPINHPDDGQPVGHHWHEGRVVIRLCNANSVVFARWAVIFPW